MARFHFRAVAGTGEVVEGDLDAATEAEVVATLRGQGRMPLRVEATPFGAARARSAAGQWFSQPLFRRRRVRRRDVALMTRELATLLDAGLTLDHSLRLMIDLVEGDAMPALLEDLLQQVQSGSSLADALARHEAVFSQTYISMVRAGEAGGSLDEVLARIAGFLDQAEALSEQVKSALIYPILVLAIAGLSIGVLLTVVLPQFTPLFEGADAELPLLTQILIGLGDFMQRYWWALALGLIATVWLVRRQWRRPASRARIDAWLLRLPLVGPLVAKIDTARFARTLGTLLANGVPVLSALAIVQDSLGNASLRQAVADAPPRASPASAAPRPATTPAASASRSTPRPRSSPPSAPRRASPTSPWRSPPPATSCSSRTPATRSTPTASRSPAAPSATSPPCTTAASTRKPTCAPSTAPSPTRCRSRSRSSSPSRPTRRRRSATSISTAIS
jgi:general secretion pathway protein F